MNEIEKYFNREQDVKDIEEYLRRIKLFKNSIENSSIKERGKILVESFDPEFRTQNWKIPNKDNGLTVYCNLGDVKFLENSVPVGLKIRDIEKMKAYEAISNKALLFTNSGEYLVPLISVINSKKLNEKYLAYFVQSFKDVSLKKGENFVKFRENIEKIIENKGFLASLSTACCIKKESGKKIPAFYDTDPIVQINIKNGLENVIESRYKLLKEILTSEEYSIKFD